MRAKLYDTGREGRRVKTVELASLPVSRRCGEASPSSAVNLERREEVGDLGSRSLRSIRAVHRVGVDALREIGADRAGRCLLRIRRAHQIAILRDRVLTFEHL